MAVVVRERWLPVVGYERHYEVSDLGRVRSLDRVDRLNRSHKGRVLKPGVGHNGYPLVSLWSDGVGTSRTVHSLVAEAFIGPRPAGKDICHSTGNRNDPRLANLRYDTRAANLEDAKRHGTLANSSKTHCVRGHALSLPNLVLYPWRKKGYRNCLACTKELHAAKYRKRAFDVQRANQNYARIMGEKAGLK